MNNERSNGDGRGDGGADGVDGLSGPDESTVVIVSDRYSRESIGRLGGVLRDVADRSDGLGELGQSSASRERAALIAEEMADDMDELSMSTAGIARGLRRAARIYRHEAAVAAMKEGTT